MIVEPVIMNAGIIPPADGSLAAIRDLLHAAGALLIFDEVKTGFTTGPGPRHRAAGRDAGHGLPRQGTGVCGPVCKRPSPSMATAGISSPSEQRAA